MGQWMQYSFFISFSIYFLRYVLMTRVMYLFPVAAVKNCHKFRGLKQQKCVLSHFWKPEVWNQYHWDEVVSRASLPSQDPGESFFFTRFWWQPVFCHLSSLPLWSHCLLLCTCLFSSVYSKSSPVPLSKEYLWLHLGLTPYLEIFSFFMSERTLFL